VPDVVDIREYKRKRLPPEIRMMVELDQELVRLSRQSEEFFRELARENWRWMQVLLVVSYLNIITAFCCWDSWFAFPAALFLTGTINFHRLHLDYAAHARAEADFGAGAQQSLERLLKV